MDRSAAASSRMAQAPAKQADLMSIAYQSRRMVSRLHCFYTDPKQHEGDVP